MGRTVFHGGKVFDGSGSPPASADVVIEDARIVEVGRGLDGDDGVDCTGKALLPGLFDCHVHLAFRYEDFDEYARMQEPFSLGFYRSVQNLRTTIGLGITTVRDASGADAGLRIAVDEGTLVGPRMQVSVSMLSMTGGHNDPWLPSGTLGIFGVGYPGMPSGVCDGVDGVTRKVREMVRAGADVIKIASSGGFLSPTDDPMEPNFSQEEVDAIVRAAADLGTWVMSHAHGPEGIKRAVRAGVRSIDHGTYLDDEGIELMLEHGTWLVPTLTAGDTTDAIANDSKVSPAVRAKLADLGRPEFDAFRRAVDAGVKVAMGTDCPVAPHGTNLNELRHMEANGFTPAQALHATTLSAAELMGLDAELGTLEPGKRADLVVLDGDPLVFDDYESRIDQVWKDGARVVPFALTHVG
ncbi:MAG TPA: amidohydrolase family protein [Actinomycetota bacterium]|nr:amidohydrolase family protein [Actinomycetota bacterium]